MSSLCSLSQSIVLHNQNDIENNDFLAISILPEVQIQAEVTAAVEFSKSSASVGISSFLNYLTIANKANNLISALNTNAMIVIGKINNQYRYFGYPTSYSPYSALSSMSSVRINCGDGNPITPAALPEYLYQYTYTFIRSSYLPSPGTPTVAGFFGGCTPLQSLLTSTLDCLYNITCIQLLLNYFPALNQVCIIYYSII